MLSLYQPRRTWTEECRAHRQPSSDPLLCSEGRQTCELSLQASWGLRPPPLQPRHTAPPSRFLCPNHTGCPSTLQAHSYPRNFKSAAPSTWNASPPSLQAGSFLSFRVQTSFLREACSSHSHTQSNHPTVSCTVLRSLFLSYLLQLECPV